VLKVEKRSAQEETLEKPTLGTGAFLIKLFDARELCMRVHHLIAQHCRLQIHCQEQLAE
jgi:hypothetical protein